MSSIDRPPISAQRFDALVDGAKPEHLWGAASIAAAAGVSEDTIRRSWSRLPDVPIRRCGGRYFALRSELIAWMKGAVPSISQFPPVSPSGVSGT